MKIEKTFDIHKMVNTSGSVYFETENMKVSIYHGSDTWRIVDITNALKTGKTCTEYSLQTAINDRDNLPVTNYISHNFGNDLKKLFNFCETIEFKNHKYGGLEHHDIGDIRIYKSLIKGVRVYSPFAKIAPLKKFPKKWTLRHVFAALNNGQFKDLKCKGVYTDDYAYDNAVNYRMGEIKAPDSFLKRILESPSGWWCFEQNGVVSICCHSFDSNEFTPVI